MGSTSLPDDFEIAPNYRVANWICLTLDDPHIFSPDWETAITILDARICARFIEPAQLLIDLEAQKERGTNGFAVLAIDFLLIEMIQGFRTGCCHHVGQSKALFKNFLSSWPKFCAYVPEGKDADIFAIRVYEQGRCALHHTGSTDRIVVKRSGDMFDFKGDGRIIINRSGLHENLANVFREYIASLKEPENSNLRKNFRNKMDNICK